MAYEIILLRRDGGQEVVARHDSLEAAADHAAALSIAAVAPGHPWPYRVRVAHGDLLPVLDWDPGQVAARVAHLLAVSVEDARHIVAAHEPP